ncbi:MAG: ROK family protein, partial [Bacteroidota bacterium]
DIGGTNTKIGLVDQNGKIHDRQQFATWEGNSKNAFFRHLFSAIDAIVPDGNFRNIAGIGIDAPSCIPEQGIIKAAVNLPIKGEVPIVDLLTHKFKVPTYLCNDANAAALGEGQFGNAQGMKNFVVITLGTGLGAGIIVNGQILTGQSGLSGEMGHITAIRNGRKCNCGRSGCLETYISARGIRRNFLAQLAEFGEESTLDHLRLDQITTREIGKAAKRGDKIAIKAFEYGGTILGEHLADYVHLFEPEAIILAGGVAQVGDILFTPTINALFKNLLPNYVDHLQVFPSALGENEAALLGASTLVFDKPTVQI